VDPLTCSDAPVPVVRALGLTKEYVRGRDRVRALDRVSLDVDRGDFVAVVGPSGSGKTTLLNLLGGLDTPTDGSVRIDGRDVAAMSDIEATDFRRGKLGFVFQFFNLLPGLRAWENVAVPALLDGRRMRDARPRAEELLEQVGLLERSEHLPSELSGGELQRLSLARALMPDPVLVLADEPTGNLDAGNGTVVLQLLREAAAQGRAVVVATHDVRVTEHATRTVTLRDGAVEADPRGRPNP
jgi:putative ABC transport system ATP-binding protein